MGENEEAKENTEKGKRMGINEREDGPAVASSCATMTQGFCCRVESVHYDDMSSGSVYKRNEMHQIVCICDLYRIS